MESLHEKGISMIADLQEMYKVTVIKILLRSLIFILFLKQ